ncbi:MAG: N-formylglutamate deformylase [Alphaproteobacteria bacterium]
MNPVSVSEGASPIILAMPHTGTFVPEEIWDNLSPLGQTLEDTDWHVHRLYDGLLPEATIVRATFHRYVIDANRDPTGASLYPGQNTTGLCPVIDFENKSLYKQGGEPDSAEIARRLETYHAPYHAALAAQIERIKSLHGIAVLYDCHSIQSRKPFLFEGTLPDFNIGTNEGKTCAPHFQDATAQVCAEAEGYTHVVNGRFKGGWTTRHYGQPDQNIHAIQMELTQSNYMSETAPWGYYLDKAALIRPHLTKILLGLETLSKELSRDR